LQKDIIINAMREIKFRAYDKEDGMLYPEFSFNGKNSWSSHGCGADMLVYFRQETEDGKGKYHEDPDPNLEELVWMQYTGLKDKNGKEIYEGDVIDSPNCGREVVEWENGGFINFQECAGPSVEPGECEIIGNKYDNPQLLK
jgi:uncharacterized phage protein (TIGR01671 family)